MGAIPTPAISLRLNNGKPYMDIVFLVVQDIKDELPNESCFDLFGYTRVGSREQTVNLPAASPSLVRVQLAEIRSKVFESSISR